MRNFLIATMLLLGACVGAGVAPDPATRIAALPASIAGFARGPVQRYPDPGLGASVNYEAPATRATVYAYDRGRRDLATAPGGAVDQELRQALGEIQSAVRAGLYRGGTSGPAADVGSFRCVPVTVILASGLGPDSFICVTVSRGQFVKLRFTGPSGGQPLMRAFLAELTSLL